MQTISSRPDKRAQRKRKESIAREWKRAFGLSPRVCVLFFILCGMIVARVVQAVCFCVYNARALCSRLAQVRDFIFFVYGEEVYRFVVVVCEV